MDTELNIPHMGEVDYFAALLLKQLRHEITEAELQELENWKAGHPSFARVCEQVNDGEQLLADLIALKQVDMEGWWQKISDQIETVKKPVPVYRRWYAYAAAAVLLLAAGTFAWKYLMPDKTPATVNGKNVPVVADVPPGGNRATLTLSNGAVIDLGNAGNGQLAQEGNMNVLKPKEGELKYEPATSNPRQAGAGRQPAVIAYNTLSTPRGGQYSLVLPDGSQVWLNATSSIKYPTQFTENERRVTITGEVYFEVKSLAKKLPFIVTVQSQAGANLEVVEVLGTRFNIMAYDDEATAKTTLLKGKVKISVPGDNFRLLQPGQQAQIPQQLAGNGIKVIEVEDVEDVAGWKDGLVTLKNADVKTIMRILARWYNVEISYQGNTSNYTFTGTLPLKNNLSVVMKLLEYNGVHLTLQQNHKIIVKP
ncbi:hypothetical protein A3860_30565 [Niastella vici]|uniref:Iron dicitrate transport regulator FecR n=1 Tax=Niastella vici TaxID=1703345 RepID=A0A1V9FTZ1_9BACT|nr:FecR family protein [Niastella vici]OQP61812.1 hypothetical protein A3860_30565 [Niastella vici]